MDKDLKESMLLIFFVIVILPLALTFGVLILGSIFGDDSNKDDCIQQCEKN